MNHRDGHVLSQEEVNAKLETLTAPKVTPEQLEAQIVSEVYHVFPDTCLTVCVLTLKNGFTVSGESACASPENFNAEVGRSISRRNAKDKIWALEGYALRTKLAFIEQAGAPTGLIQSLGSKPVTYVGTKVVHAVPMTRRVYNELRGWAVPADEDPTDAGYLVQYADGGAPNVTGYTGYVSWSPKDIFEGSYSIGVTLKESTFLTRLEEEYDQLMEKLRKLSVFLSNPSAKELPILDYALLSDQRVAMETYAGILQTRLRRLTHTNTNTGSK